MNLSKPALAILTPTRGAPHDLYRGALQYNVELPGLTFTIAGKPVDIARNELAAHVRTLTDRPRYVLWIDDDAFWFRGTISRLIAELERVPNPRRSVIGGLFSMRFPFDPPVAYRRHGRGFVAVSLPKRRVGVQEAPMVARCDVMGSHFLLHRTELLDALDSEPWSVSADLEADEVFMFAERVRAVGGSFFVDLTLPIFHCDGEYLYLPNAPAMTMVDGKPTPAIAANRRGSHRRYGSRIDAVRNRPLERDFAGSDAG